MAIADFDLVPDKPSYPVQIESLFPVDPVSNYRGYFEEHRRGVHALRRATLRWSGAGVPTRDFVRSFFSQFNGARGPLSFTLPGFLENPSGIVPKLEDVAGGSLLSREYKIVFSWFDGTSKTTLASAIATKTIAANNLVKVTVPVKPLNVSHFRIYAAETPNPRETQSTGDVDTALTWTEPATGLETTGAAEPSVNNLAPKDYWMLENTSIQFTMYTTRLFNFTLVFREIFKPE